MRGATANPPPNLSTAAAASANQTTTSNHVRTVKPSLANSLSHRTPDKINNNVYQHHAYCINCIKKDHICAECEFVLSASRDQNSIYCVIEKGELHEMKILRKPVQESASATNKTTASAAK